MAASNTRIRHIHAEEFTAFITVKTMPEIMRKLIPDDVHPAFICTSYCHNKDKYNKALKLSEKEQKVLSNLSSGGFQKCDTPLLYKLCQYFDFVTAPSKGWGTFHHQLQNVGDALEAIIKLRHEYICNSTRGFKAKFDRMVEIAKVVDKELSAARRFEDAVVFFSVDDFNDKYLHELKTAFKQIKAKATNGPKGSFKDDVLKEDEPMSFEENYNPNVLQKPIVLSPDLFEKMEIEHAIEIKCKDTEDDKVFDEKDYLTNVRKNRLKISPSLSQNLGKHPISEIKEIKEMTHLIGKKGTTKEKDVATIYIRSNTE